MKPVGVLGIPVVGLAALIATAGAGGAGAACSSSSSSSSGGTGQQSTAAAVTGAQDNHCVMQGTVAVDPAQCYADAGDGGAGDDGGGGNGGFGDTMYNSEGDDDDCKYHVKWTSSPVTENADVNFVVTATNKKDGTPVKGIVHLRAELASEQNKPGPNTNQDSTEGAAGVYTIGPVRFNTPGKWTVRFHLHEECNDSPTSPHGHGAFFVQVP
jgi:hypothetical protein